jgi:ABC-type lipoprotein export system ATPase subunit
MLLSLVLMVRNTLVGYRTAEPASREIVAVVTHDRDFAAAADRAIVMSDGRIIAGA